MPCSSFENGAKYLGFPKFFTIPAIFAFKEAPKPKQFRVGFRACQVLFSEMQKPRRSLTLSLACDGQECAPFLTIVFAVHSVSSSIDYCIFQDGIISFVQRVGQAGGRGLPVEDGSP